MAQVDEWEPALPEPNERGNYPLLALDVVLALDILRARRQLGLTQEELARRARIPSATLCRIERGKRKPNLATVEKIDRALKNAEAKKRNNNSRRKNKT